MLTLSAGWRFLQTLSACEPALASMQLRGHFPAQVHPRQVMLASHQAVLLHNPVVALMFPKQNQKQQAPCMLLVVQKHPSHSKRTHRVQSPSQAVGLVYQQRRRKPLVAVTDCEAMSNGSGKYSIALLLNVQELCCGITNVSPCMLLVMRDT